MNTTTETQHGDASSPVLLLIPDVFFSVTVRNAVRRIGFAPHILKTVDDLVVAAGERDAVLAIVDLSAVRSSSGWDDIAELADSGLPVLVFGAHKDVDGLRAAKAAGVTRVVSNGQFHREMADLIRRYALAGACALTDETVDTDAPLTSLPPGMTGHIAEQETAGSATGA